MQTPKISVIMLTYNREDLVGRAIESIITQTLRDFEFIIVDNGSTDQSGAIADKYAANDSRIYVIHRERGNIGSGRNTGLDAVKGEYIAFIDDDDWVESDFLEFLYNLADKNNADIAICGADKTEGDVVTLVGIDECVVYGALDAIIDLMWRKRFNNGFPTKLIKKTLFSQLRFPEIGRYEDIYLMYKVLAQAERISSYGKIKYHVNYHQSNNSSATTKDRMITPQYLNDYRKAYRERTLWLCARFPNNAEYWWYFDWSFQISMINKIITNDLKECTLHLSEMQSDLSAHKEEFLSCPWIQGFEMNWVKRCIHANNRYTWRNGFICDS